MLKFAYIFINIINTLICPNFVNFVNAVINKRCTLGVGPLTIFDKEFYLRLTVTYYGALKPLAKFSDNR